MSAKTALLSNNKVSLAGDIVFKTSEAGLEEIRHDTVGWLANGGVTFNLGFSTESYWLKIELDNQTSNTDWFLTLNNSRLDYVDFYLFNDKDTQSFYAGDHRSSIGHISSYPTFNFILEQNQTAQLYIRIKSSARISFNPIVRGSQAFGRYDTERYHLHLFYILVFVLYAMFQVLMNNGLISKMNFWHCSGLMFCFVYILFYYGEGNRIFWPENVILKNRMYFVFSSACLFCFMQFLKKYLRSKVVAPKFHMLVKTYLVFSGVCTIVMLLPIQNIVRVQMITWEAYGICFIAFFGAVKSIRAGQWWAFGVSMPLFFSVLALMVYASTFLGLLPHSEFTAQLILWSLPFDLVMLSISFFFRHIAIRSKNEELMKKLSEMSKEHMERASQKKSLLRLSENNRTNRLSGIDAENTLVRLTHYLDEERAFLLPGLTLEEVACKLDLRADQLSAIINSELNISFSTLINLKRLEEAAILLTLETEKTILDIALQCGFGSKSNFNRLFKLQFETTPRLAHFNPRL